MLKKIVLTIAMVAFAASAFATGPVVSTGSWPTSITFVPSKSVVLGYTSGLPSGVTAGNNSIYSIASKNKAGDRVYATTSTSTAIVQSVAVTGADLVTGDIPSLPSTGTDSVIQGGHGNWTVM